MRLLVIGREGQLARALAHEAGLPHRDGGAIPSGAGGAIPSGAGGAIPSGAGGAILRSAGGARAVEARYAGRADIDITEPAALDRLMADTAPDVVVNTAAYTAVDRAETEPDAAFRVNATGAGAISAAAARRGIGIVHVSTDYVFDGRRAEGAYVETDPTSPLGVYGRSKLAGEGAVAAANPRHLIVRTSWLVGPRGANFLVTMLRLAAERPALRVVADQHGTPTVADDLAAALIELACLMADAPADDARWGLYHAANTGETTWHGLATAIVDEAGRNGRPAPPVTPITTAEYPTPAARPAVSRLSCEKLASAFAVRLPPWEPSVRAAVRAALSAS